MSKNLQPKVSPITIHSNEESGWCLLNISWDRNALCSKYRLKAYTNPNGDDGNSLKVQVNEKKSLRGCIIDRQQDAFLFKYNFIGKRAELYINKSAISMKAAHASIPLLLTGKYGFKDEVEIHLNFEPSPSWDIRIPNSFVTLRPYDDVIAELVLSSDALPGNDAIDVKVERTSSCKDYVRFLDFDIEPFTIQIFPQKETILKIVVIGKKFANGLAEDHNCPFKLETAFAKAELILKLLKGDNRNDYTPNEREVVLNLSKNIKIDSEKDEVVVYTGMTPKPFSFEVKATSFDTTVRQIASNSDLLKVKSKLSFLAKNNQQKLAVEIVPATTASDVDANITIKADYSKPSQKKIVIKTKDSKPSKAKISFDVKLDNDIYYLGQGKIKLGILKICCISDGTNKEQVQHLRFDSNEIRCTLENTFVSIETKRIDLALGEEVCLDVFIEATEDNWRSPLGNTEICFNIDNVSSKSREFQVKKRIPEILDFNFTPLKPYSLVYDETHSNLQIGNLDVSYSSKPNEIKYLHRKNGKFSLTCPILRFGNLQTDQALESGIHSYPVYVELKDDVKKLKKSSDVIILYKDNLEERTFPINAWPILEMSWIDSDGKTNYISIDSKSDTIVAPCHEFPSSLRNQGIQKCFEIIASNIQPIVQNGKRLIISSIKYESSSDFVHVDTADVILANGDTHSIKFAIDYNCLPIPVPKEVKIELSFDDRIIVDENDSVPENGEMNKHIEVIIPLKELIYDNWYSVDLGTTGIVVAKWDYNKNRIGPVVLQDVPNLDDRIEKDDNIISSNTILKCNDNRSNCSVVVSPSLPDWKMCDDVLVSCKFIVGQDHIPHSKEYAERYPDGAELEIGSIKSWETLTPSDIIKFTYKTIFNKIDNSERDKVRKLIVTYPNTYTPVLLGRLRNLIVESGLFPNLQTGDLHLIPESDSVVAYYINKKINDEGIDINPGEIKRMIIYDMGAGTLDLSLIELSNTDGNLKANFIKRIGIPIAGEYFTYLLYKQYEGKWANVNKGLKIYLDKVKRTFTEGAPLQATDETENYVKDKNLQIEIGEELREWISICTDNVFSQLVGEDWKNKVDLIVYSGRGSQFKPIRDAICDSCRDDIYIDESSIQVDELKQCVAHGAILYQQIFQNINRPFNIEHHNTCLNIGVEYTLNKGSKGKFKTCREYEQILGAEDFQEDSKEINGSYFSSYKPKNKDFDFSEDGEVIFYINSLSEDEMKDMINDKKNKKWCFVSTLFSFNTSLLGLNNPKRKKARVHIETDSNNGLFMKVIDLDLNKKATIENIENNDFYRACNWFLKNNE